MSAPEIPEVVIAAMAPGCERCSFHGFACQRHGWEALDVAQSARARLEHQVTVLTFALGELGGKGGAA